MYGGDPIWEMRMTVGGGGLRAALHLFVTATLNYIMN